jgi:hypothetical protein
MLHLARLEKVLLAIYLRPTIQIIRHRADQWAPRADQWAPFNRKQIMIVLFKSYFCVLNFSLWRHRPCLSYTVPGLETLSKGILKEAKPPTIISRHSITRSDGFAQLNRKNCILSEALQGSHQTA